MPVDRRRACALLLLCVITGFAVAAAWDACGEDACAIDCHFACVTGCVHAVVSEPAVPLAADAASGRAAAARSPHPLSRTSEPEPQPPRA